MRAADIYGLNSSCSLLYQLLAVVNEYQKIERKNIYKKRLVSAATPSIYV